MSYTQLVQPNLSVTGRIGWCLEYAFRVFGCTHYEPSAWQAWTNTQFKHQDADLPQDVAVPMWYSYWANLDGTGVKNWGHVTINVPGQGIYSSPWKGGTTHAVLSSINEVERIYGVKYGGWSEDILQLKVIEGDDMPTDAQIDEWISLFHQETYGSPPPDAIFAAWRPTLKNNFVDGSLGIMQGTANNPGALMNKSAASSNIVPYSGTQLYVKQ